MASSLVETTVIVILITLIKNNTHRNTQLTTIINLYHYINRQYQKRQQQLQQKQIPKSIEISMKHDNDDDPYQEWIDIVSI